MSSPPFRYKRLGYLAVNVSDLERSVGFYRDVVGLAVSEHRPGKIAYLRCGPNYHDLLLYSSSEIGLKRIAFELEGDVDVDNAARALERLKVEYQVVSDKERAELGQRRSLRFRLPGCMAEMELYSGSVLAPVPYEPTVAKILRLGHCVIKSAGFPQTIDWLTNHFGFKVSDHIRGEHGEVIFLRCWPNPYHHSLGIARADSNALHHFAFMVKDIDDIGKGGNRLPKEGSSIVFGPGRHLASGSIFLYFLDPDGITIEYTCGMEEFSADTPREPRILPPTLEVADLWGGRPKPEACSVGTIEGAGSESTPPRTGVF